MASLKAALWFAVRRRAAVLVPPAASTPRELKRLSDIDNHEWLQLHIPIIQFYRRKESMRSEDPAVVIRRALSKALVDYYPLAGRLRELQGRKIAVDCTGEGVLFTEADADVRLEQFGSAQAQGQLLPPFPCLSELMPGSSAILNSPILLFQVTRLACGSFILGLQLNHTMVDGQGVVQFLGAVAEVAHGVPAAPTLRPVWHREMLESRDPPRPRFPHPELDEMPDTNGIIMGMLDEMAYRCILFGPQEVAAIRAQLPPRLQKSATRFDAVVGWLWKCRTAALAPLDPDEETRMFFTVNVRGRGRGRAEAGIPVGYYGNAFSIPVAVSTAGELCANPVGYAVELVNKAKQEVDMEYIRSTADLMVMPKPKLVVPSAAAFAVSDTTKARFADLDFGWGRAVYGGPAEGVSPVLPWFLSFLLPFKNAKGEDGIAVPMALPLSAMDRVVVDMGKLLQVPDDVDA